MSEAIAIRSMDEGGALGEPIRGRPSPRRRVLLAWLLAVLWAAVIWKLGTDEFSLTRTSPWMAWLVELVFGEVDLPTRYKIYTLLRKTAHFVEYAILALLSFRAAMLTASRARIATACWIALFFVGTVAAADEVRQGFSAVRTGSPWDVLIDVAGGLVGLIGVAFLTRRMRARKG